MLVSLPLPIEATEPHGGRLGSCADFMGALQGLHGGLMGTSWDFMLHIFGSFQATNPENNYKGAGKGRK